jgi:hypothetical protein
MGIAIETSRNEDGQFSTKEQLSQIIGKDHRENSRIKSFFVKDLIPQQISFRWLAKLPA